MGMYWIKKLLHSKGNKVRKQSGDWEELFASHTSDKVLKSRI
jgi:hypothetical protein